MFPMSYLALSYLFGQISKQRQRLVRSYRDNGYTTETILVASLLVVLAIAVVAVLADKVKQKANNINLDAVPGG